MPADSRSQAAPGRFPSDSPYRPPAAATAAAMIATGVVAMTQPAGSHGVPKLMYAVQLPAPRSAVAAETVRVVVPACSTYGRKLNAYLPCSSSGSTHHTVASTTAAPQQAASR